MGGTLFWKERIEKDAKAEQEKEYGKINTAHGLELMEHIWGKH